MTLKIIKDVLSNNTNIPSYPFKCPFCSFYTREINMVQCRNASVIHLQEYHKISDPLVSIPRMMGVLTDA